MRILVVEPNKAPYEKEMSSGLKSMQEVVGGLIQAIYPFDEPVALVCNEEGKLLGLPPNRALRDSQTGAIYDVVVGTFFLCAAPSDSENFRSLSEEQSKTYKAVFSLTELFLNIGGQLIVLRNGKEECE